MAKLSLTDIATFGASAITAINNNNAAIETAMENTLSRDGTTPNSMSADLDMNSNTILNLNGLDMNGTRIYDLPAPLLATEPLRLQDLLDFLGNGLEIGVQGPVSSTDNAIVRFDGTDGALVQNSTAIISDTGKLTINGTDTDPSLTITTDSFLSLKGASHATELVAGIGTTSPYPAWIQARNWSGASAQLLSLQQAGGGLAINVTPSGLGSGLNSGVQIGDNWTNQTPYNLGAPGGAFVSDGGVTAFLGLTGWGRSTSGSLGIGVQSYVFADNASLVGSWCYYGEAHRISQNDICSVIEAAGVNRYGAVSVFTPYSASASVAVIGITSGNARPSTEYNEYPCDAAIVITQNAGAGNTCPFMSGITFQNASLDVTAGQGYAINFDVSHALTWWSDASTVTSQILSTALSGLIIRKGASNVMIVNSGATGIEFPAYGAGLLQTSSAGVVSALTVGAGVTTWLSTPSSANFASVITDETGTGRLVFNTSPGFTTAINPLTDDAAALGTSTLGWSDLFLATGGTIHFANTDWVATHTAGILTVGTGDLRITTAGTNAASVVTVGGTQTLTAKTLTSPIISTSPTAAGSTWANLGSVTTVDINGGTIDGVVIGGSTSAAGTFTTVTAATSVTSPLLIGGTAVGSTLTLKSTSAVGTTDAIIIQVGNNGAVEAGRWNTSGQYVANAGSVSAPGVAFTGALGTGIYLPAANTGGLTGGGTEIARWSSSGINFGSNPASIAIGANANFQIVGTGFEAMYLVSTAGVISTIAANQNSEMRIGTASNHNIMLLINAGSVGYVTGSGTELTGYHWSRTGTATPAAASAVVAFKMGSAGIGVYWGTGDPNTALTAPKGSLYTRTDGSSSSTRLYVNTDGVTAWTNVTTAA